MLDKIVEYKTEELSQRKRKFSLQDVKLKANDQEPAISFLKNFSKSDLNVIAEVKKASPSAGVICENFEPVRVANQYYEAGAKSLSVLTDEKFFQGHLDYLLQIKNSLQNQIPILRKDFTLHEYHIFEARAYQADAVLLIAAILDDHQLKDFQALTHELGMMVLLEIHDDNELQRALKLNPKLLGINNRNLKTFQTDTKTSLDLIKHVPKSQDSVVISESGIKTHEDLISLANAGIEGFLVGEGLMKASHPGEALRRLLQG